MHQEYRDDKLESRTFVLGKLNKIRAYQVEYNPVSKKHEKTNEIYKPIGGIFLNQSKHAISFWKEYRTQ